MYSEKTFRRERVKHKNRRRTRKRKANTTHEARKERRISRARTVALQRARDERFDMKSCKIDERLTEEFYIPWSYEMQLLLDKAKKLSRKTKMEYSVDIDQGSSSLYALLGDEDWKYIIPMIRSYLPPSFSVSSCHFQYGYYCADVINLGVISPPNTESICFNALPKKKMAGTRIESDLIRVEHSDEKILISVDEVYMNFIQDDTISYVCRKGDIILVAVRFGQEFLCVLEFNIEDFVEVILPKMKDISVSELKTVFLFSLYMQYYPEDQRRIIGNSMLYMSASYIRDTFRAKEIPFGDAIKTVSMVALNQNRYYYRRASYYTKMDLQRLEKKLQIHRNFKASLKKGKVVW